MIKVNNNEFHELTWHQEQSAMWKLGYSQSLVPRFLLELEQGMTYMLEEGSTPNHVLDVYCESYYMIDRKILSIVLSSAVLKQKYKFLNN